MTDKIISSISVTLNKEFGDNYTIYADSVKQGLKKPCFFIRLLNPTQRVYLGRRYLRTNLFNISFFPQSDTNEECMNIADRLFMCLEILPCGVRGTNMKYEIVDNILHFFVHYDYFFDVLENTETMENLSIENQVKE